MIRKRIYIIIYITLISLPVFVVYSSGSLRFNFMEWDPSVFVSGASLHLGLLATAFITIIGIISIVYHQKLSINNITIIVILIIVMFTFSFLSGLFINASFINFIYYIQTISPIFAYFIGYSIYNNEKEKIISRTFIVVNSISLLSLYIYLIYNSSIFFYNSGELYQLLRSLSVPQFKRYIPIVYSISFSFILGHIFDDKTRKTKYYVALILHLMFLPLMWSRAGLLTVLLVIFFHVIIRLGGNIKRRHFRKFVSLSLIMVVGITYLFAQTDGVIEKRLVGDYGSLDEADERRMEIAIYASEIILMNPVLGEKFVPDWDKRIGGMDSGIKRMIDPHNQYLDYGLRGGLINLVLLSSIIFLAMRRSFKKFNNSIHPSNKIIYSSIFAIISGVAVSNLFQLNFTLAYTGSILWLLIGVLFNNK